ncbi:hypothetical protein B0H14DRAFT_3157559 [Mycena olivaceomarginata]|nr:hypothetical protein B0H14DRAFT_3157559 [Mycena olivaceomarginata]
MSTDLRKRLMELNKQITEQRLVLEQLQHARLDVECELHATATYPVLTLPTEITAEIFVHCLPFFGPWSTIPRVCKKWAPIILFAVCHAWHDIALTTPKLWSKLAVWLDDIPHGVVSEPGLVESYIDRWLDRAGNCPLPTQSTATSPGWQNRAWTYTLEQPAGIMFQSGMFCGLLVPGIISLSVMTPQPGRIQDQGTNRITDGLMP